MLLYRKRILEPIVRRLSIKHGVPLKIVGGVSETGYSRHDVDIESRTMPTEDDYEKASIIYHDLYNEVQKTQSQHKRGRLFRKPKVHVDLLIPGTHEATQWKKGAPAVDAMYMADYKDKIIDVRPCSFTFGDKRVKNIKCQQVEIYKRKTKFGFPSITEMIEGFKF